MNLSELYVETIAETVFAQIRLPALIPCQLSRTVHVISLYQAVGYSALRAEQGGQFS